MPLPVGNFTFYHNAENCPHKAYRMYVKRDLPREEKTPEQNFGNHVHTAMEMRLGRGAELPKDLVKVEPICRELEALPSDWPQRTELQLAFKEDGTPCSWYADGEWFRIKLDWHVRAPAYAWLIDWKTGKCREEPFELECQALALKINYPQLTHIVGEYFWMQEWRQGLRYHLNRFPEVFAKLQSIRAELQGYEQADEWPKRKNPLCGWCPVHDCQYNTVKKRLAREEAK